MHRAITILGQPAHLSQERISFSHLPLFSVVRRVVFITNTSLHTLSFQWELNSETAKKVSIHKFVEHSFMLCIDQARSHCVWGNSSPMCMVQSYTHIAYTLQLYHGGTFVHTRDSTHSALWMYRACLWTCMWIFNCACTLHVCTWTINGPHLPEKGRPTCYVASFPGPTQLSIACSTASDEKLGMALQYCKRWKAGQGLAVL